LKPLDTVRLEIVYSNRREWYGSPGDRSFHADRPVEFIGSGMIGDGAFAITLGTFLRAAFSRIGAKKLWAAGRPLNMTFTCLARSRGLGFLSSEGLALLARKVLSGQTRNRWI
jgi:hypothetical protein